MSHSLRQRFGNSLALFTDLYQLTMAYAHWKQERAEQRAVFHLCYRRPPVGNAYVLAAGLADVVDWLIHWQMEASDLAYLATLTTDGGQPLFEAAFLDYLAQLRFTGHLDAVAEGTVVFPHQPILRVEGPILQAQLIETALLNIVNFQTLIATQAARLVQAAQGDPVLEFGARRAQGWDGALSASRAAYLGGCAATSNLLAGKCYGIPVKGTHSHSWVMSFDSELAAFEAYADAFPDQALFLVDTYNSLEGIQKAIQVGQRLREKGHTLLGIRLDSGDLLSLSQQARRLLDRAGFEQAVIMGSDELDAARIRALKAQGAAIQVWGVGTHLVTSADQPSLGAVYKLGALQSAQGDWQPKIKLSDTPEKISTPGKLQVRRYALSNGQPFGDMIWNELAEPPLAQFHSQDGRMVVAEGRGFQDLLQPILYHGQLIQPLPHLEQSRFHAQTEQARFETVDFRWYPVGLEKQLNALKLAVLQQHWPKH